MIHAKTKDTNLHIEGPDDNGHYWLYLSASGETCRIDLGVPRGMVETALLMAASVKFGRPGGDYTLAPHLQKIVDGAKTAPQWDMQADRLAPTDAAHVNETPKSEHDADNVLTAAQAREAAARLLLDMLNMRNGAHEGVSKKDVQKMWDAAGGRHGFAAVDAFLRSIIKEART